MKHKFIIFLTLIFTGPLFAQRVPKFRIDPAHAYGGSVSEYFDSVEYIPLETTKESLFGAVYEMIATDSSYVIADADTKSVLFFSRDGKFINKIRGTFSMVYDQSKKQIVTFKISADQTNLYLTYFSLSGKKMQPEVTVSLRDVNSSRINIFSKVLEKDYFLYLNNYSDEQNRESTGPCYFFSVYRKDSLYKNLIPIKQNVSKITKKLSAYMTLPGVVENGTFYVSSPLDFYLYKANKDTAVEICQLVFPAERVLSKNVIESANDKFLDSVKSKVYFDRSLIMNVENIFFSGTKLFFKIRTPSSVIAFNTSLNEYQYNFLYDTLSKNLISLDRITPDSSSCFLPIMGETSKMRGIIPSNKHFYSYISSLVMFSSYNAVKSKHPHYPPVLQKYFETQNRKSNPVIVRMKLKDF